MNSHDHETHLEQAALYSVGALPEQESARFESPLADGCPTCEAELALLRPAIDALADAVLPLAPRPELRARLFARAQQAAELPVIASLRCVPDRACRSRRCRRRRPRRRVGSADVLAARGAARDAPAIGRPRPRARR